MSVPSSVRSALAPVALLCASTALADAPTRVSSFGRLPLTFERNTGRYDKRVQFLARTRGATVFVTANQMVMVLPAQARGPSAAGHDPGSGRLACARNAGEPPGLERSSLNASGDRPGASPLPARSHVLRMKLVGANAKAVATGLQKQPGIVNYFIGNDPTKWRTRVPTYAKAKLAGAYPGVDVVYYGTEQRARGQEARGAANIPSPRLRGEGQGEGRHSLSALRSPLPSLEFDFVVHPGADPKRIKLAFEGADRIRVAGGDLILTTPAGDVRMKRPCAYQTIGSRGVEVACAYSLRRHTAALRLARYDASRPVVIDPTLEYSTYLGGSSDDGAFGIRADASGAVYLSGFTGSDNFPTTPGAFQSSKPEGWNAFVTKVDPSGTSLVYSTYLGGSGNDSGMNGDIAVDSSGHAYVTGNTSSTNFPVTSGAYQTYWSNPGMIAFITKLSPDGSSLVFSTFLGPSSGGYVRTCGIAVDGGGNTYVGGYTYDSNFPTTPGAFQTAYAGGQDAFVTKLAADGSALVYSTFLGDGGDDAILGITVDSAGAVFAGGCTLSNGFPTTPGAFCTTAWGGGYWDGFVTKLSADGSALVYSTYLGGQTSDVIYEPAVDSSGCAYVTGVGTALYPVTPGAYSATGQAVVTKLNPAGSALIYSTRLGGNGSGTRVAVDAWGMAYVVGQTSDSLFPTTPGAFQTVKAHGDDAFFVKLNANGTDAVYSTFVGGNAHERTYGGAIDGAGGAFLTGYTGSTDFPVTPGAFQTTFGGLGPLAYGDAFVTKFQFMEEETALMAGSAAGKPGETVALTATLTVGGNGLAAKKVYFSVEGAPVGFGITDDNGLATLSLPIPDTLGEGAKAIEALFPGTDGYDPSAASGTLTISRADTALWTINRTGTITGLVILRQYDLKRLSDSAMLQGKTISFIIDGTEVGTGVTNAGGDSNLNWIITDGSAARTITTAFAGDASYNGCSDDATLTCQTWATKMSGVNREGKITAYRILKAWLWKMDNSPVTGKGIAFKLDGTLLGTDNTRTTGLAQIGYTIADGAGAGVRTILAEWAGDGGYLASSCINTLNVLKATPYIWVMPKSVPVGGKVNCYAYFRRLSDYQKQLGKSVYFKVDGTPIGNALTDGTGVARYLYQTVEPAGAHTIRAEYNGDVWLEAGYGEANLTIY